MTLPKTPFHRLLFAWATGRLRRLQDKRLLSNAFCHWQKTKKSYEETSEREHAERMAEWQKTKKGRRPPPPPLPYPHSSFEYAIDVGTPEEAAFYRVYGKNPGAW